MSEMEVLEGVNEDDSAEPVDSSSPNTWEVRWHLRCRLTMTDDDFLRLLQVLSLWVCCYVAYQLLKTVKIIAAITVYFVLHFFQFCSP